MQLRWLESKARDGGRCMRVRRTRHRGTKTSMRKFVQKSSTVPVPVAADTIASRYCESPVSPASAAKVQKRRSFFVAGLRRMSSWWKPEASHQQAAHQAQATYKERSPAHHDDADAALATARLGGVPEALPPVPKPAAPSGPQYMPLNLYYPGLQKVYDKPPIYIVEDFLTEEECETLKETARPLLQRSKTHAIAGSEATKGRTSLTCHLAKKAHPCPLLLAKIQALTGKPWGHMELPQVARYTDSQRYVEHYDGVDPHTDAGRAFCANGGQRICTVLCYLNDVPEGGATAFRCAALQAAAALAGIVTHDLPYSPCASCVPTGVSSSRSDPKRAARSSSSRDS